MTEFFLGIDGGGTKTQAVIVNEHGQVCGVGYGGSANFDAIGIEATQANLQDAIAQASAQAQLPGTDFRAAFLGIAGVVSHNDHTIIHQISTNLGLSSQLGIDHDCRIALAGGLTGREGIILIVGTGSSCFGSNAAGEQWRAGGWGHLISDEGSSYWLGLEAMRAAVASYDGRIGKTLLVERIMQALNIQHMNDIMHRIYVPPMGKTEIAALAPIVIEAASLNDEIANALLSQAARDLAQSVFAVAQKLGLTDLPCEVAWVGGLLNAGAIVKDRLSASIHERLPFCQIKEPELPPVLGACLLALLQTGIPATAIAENLQHGVAMMKQ